MYETETVFLLD